MFLWYRSSELNQYSIHLDSCLSSNHASLTITISIADEIVSTSKLSILQHSKQETAFVKEVILNFKKLDMSNINDKDNLENNVKHLEVLIKQVWTKNAKKLRITKHSK